MSVVRSNTNREIRSGARAAIKKIEALLADRKARIRHVEVRSDWGHASFPGTAGMMQMMHTGQDTLTITIQVDRKVRAAKEHG